MQNVRYTAAKRRELEAARLAELEVVLRRWAAMPLEAYLAERRVDDTVVFLDEDLDQWIAGHAELVARFA